VTTKGLVVLSKKETLADVWKAWPQFLLYSYAAKQFPEKWEPQLIFTHSERPKKAFFEETDDYLKRFVNYYSLCLQNFSPLLPDWISLILEDNVSGLQDKMCELFTESYGVYQNRDLRWILNKHRLPSSEILIHYWKTQAEKLMGDVIRFWSHSGLKKSGESKMILKSNS
jgi:exodeoxyribonuclease V gamma subunit